jgi:hypothetical protein
VLEQLDPTFLGLPDGVEEAERARAIDGRLAPAVGILLAFGGAMLFIQVVLVAQLVLMLLLRDEVSRVEFGEACK